MTSILCFNNIHFSWSWPTTIFFMAILKWFGLLKSDYKSVYLKFCESSIIRILFLHYACHICWRFSFKIQFTISAAFCFDVVILKSNPAWWRHKWHDDVLTSRKNTELLICSQFHKLVSMMGSLLCNVKFQCVERLSISLFVWSLSNILYLFESVYFSCFS